MPAPLFDVTLNMQSLPCSLCNSSLATPPSKAHHHALKHITRCLCASKTWSIVYLKKASLFPSSPQCHFLTYKNQTIYQSSLVLMNFVSMLILHMLLTPRHIAWSQDFLSTWVLGLYYELWLHPAQKSNSLQSCSQQRWYYASE